jgi:hypothetical protein
VRPFTINGKQTLAFTTATGYLGFQVSDITTGKVLYTVPIRGSFPYTPGQPGPSSPSHGISLSPDEKELWVMDQPNSYVHVFDVSGLPASPPKQVADIKLSRPMIGTQVGCTYDCLREGWLQHSLDGRFVWVGDSGDVISTTTRTIVADLTPLYNSRVYLEIDYSGGVPIATSSRFGVGYVTGIGETSTNAGGTSGPATSPPTAQARPFAKLSALLVSSRMFRAADRGPSVTGTARLSTRVDFRLNISASVRFAIQRVTDGRLVGHRCETPSRRDRKARRCARYVAMPGEFAIRGHAGNNTFRFSGRLNGHTLSPGHYRLLATPVANGRPGSGQTTSITILA